MYYQNIFSRISFQPALDIISKKEPNRRNEDERRAYKVLWWLRFSMGMNSFFYLLPISWTIWLEPSHWGFCSAAGVLAVGFNNWQMKRVFNFASDKKLARYSALTESSTFTFFESFSEWTAMVVIYAVILIFVQIGLIGFSFPTNISWGVVDLAFTLPNSILGIIPLPLFDLSFHFFTPTDFVTVVPPFLKDLWFYGFLVGVINVLKMLGANCLSEGPKVRAALMSLSWIYTQAAENRFVKKE